jgi:hypothetical protein
MAGAELVPGDKHLVARAKAIRSAFDYLAGAVDSRHVRKVPDHARMSLAGEGIFVIERRVGDANQYVAIRQLILPDSLDAGRNSAVLAATHEIAWKRR